MATAGKTPEKQADKASDKAVIKPTEQTPTAKPKSDPSNWLGLSEDPKTDKSAAKSTEQKPAVATKPKSDPSDWLGLKDDEEEEEFDYLKASSFSAPAKQGQPQVSKVRHIKWTSVFRLHKMHRFRSFCPCAKYYQRLCSPFIHSVVSDDSGRGHWRPDQIMQMSRLIWAFSVHICPKNMILKMQTFIVFLGHLIGK